jgi:hypothetical protein
VNHRQSNVVFLMVRKHEKIEIFIFEVKACAEEISVIRISVGFPLIFIPLFFAAAA